MNAPAQVESAPAPHSDRIAEWILPKSRQGRLVFWALIPAIFFLSTLGIGSLKISPLTPFLPMAALSGVILSMRWRTLGLTLFYLSLGGLLFFFYRRIPFDDRVWQMGVFLSFALSSYLALLISEEVEMLFEEVESEAHERQKKWGEVSSHLRKMEGEWKDERASLEEELQTWKEEAEARRIEKASDEKRFALIQSEIELLTGQKEELISDAFEARRLASERLRRLEEQLEENERLAAAISGEGYDASGKLEEIKREKAKIEGLYQQLRVQFEEKTNLLSKTRKELFHTSEKLLAIGKEKEMKEAAPDLAEILDLLRDIETVSEENAAFEEEITTLEALISHILNP